MSDVAIQLKDLAVFAQNGDCLVEPISFSLKHGQNLIILGETGSGKSLLANAIMGALPKGLTLLGEIWLNGQQLHTGAGTPHIANFAPLWGRTLAMLAQEPTRSLDPTMTAFGQLFESVHLVKKHPKEQALTQTHHTLDTLSLSHAKDLYPHELSGGMAQRVAFGSAMLGGASMVIADEPTKGLDRTNKHTIITMLSHVAKDGGTLLTITHDIDVAKGLGRNGDVVMVIKQGKLLEMGNAPDVLTRPKSAYAQALIGASPATWQKQPMPAPTTPLLSLERLGVARGKKLLFDGLNLTIHQGQVVGLIGDSGIGKSSLGDCLCGLIPPARGKLHWHTTPKPHQVLKLYQDPPSAFSPYATLGTLLADVVARHRLDGGRIPKLMQAVGLSMSLLDRRPHEVSGGELQRFAIVRALLLEPVLLFADEVSSRLDPITQKTTMDVLTQLCHAQKTALIIVSHDHDLTDYYADVVVDLAKYRG